MSTTKIISPNVAIYVPKDLSESWRAKGIYPGAIISDKIGTVAKNKAVTNSLRSYRKSEDPFTSFIVDNKGFQISLPKKDEFGCARAWYGYGYNGVWVELHHPAINKKVIVILELDKFIDLIQTNGMTGDQINGNFSLIETSSGNGKCVIDIEPDTWSNQNSIEKKAGELLAGRLTSSWIPGHLYVTRKNEYILYLGEVSNLFCNTWGERTYYLSRTNWEYSTARKITRKSRLFVKINNIKEDLPSNTQTLSSYIKDILEHRVSLSLQARDNLGKWTGGDLGEYLTYDDKTILNLDSHIKGIAKSVLEAGTIKDRPEAFSIYSECIETSDKIRKDFLNTKKDQVKNWISRNKQYANRNQQVTKPYVWEDLTINKVLDGWYGEVSGVCTDITTNYPSFPKDEIENWKSEILNCANS